MAQAFAPGCALMLHKPHLAKRLLEHLNAGGEAVPEPAATRERGTCCGDSFYGVLPVPEVQARMRKRAGEMPCQDVAVYCVSCVKAMHIGGRRPRYLVDLLFGEATPLGTFETEAWHRQLDEFIDAH